MMPNRDGRGPRGFGIRDGFGPHGKGFRKSSKGSIFKNSRSVKGVIGKAALGVAANVGVAVAGKVIEHVALKGTDDIKEVMGNGFKKEIDSKSNNDVIYVDSVKED